MYLDTHSNRTMEKSLCAYLGVSIENINALLNKATLEAQTKCGFAGGIFTEIICDFIDGCNPQFPIDEILFFHLGSRLNAASNDVSGHNLADLLTTSNPFSEYLKTHQLEFMQRETHIEIVYKRESIPLNQNDLSSLYLRSRLGYNQGCEDYCFNGFAFKDILYRNRYAKSLSGVPEIVGALAGFFKDRKIGLDYMNVSKYYCFEYLIPIDKVIFDGHDGMSVLDKPRYLVKEILRRLNEYRLCAFRNISDEDNPLLRLAERDTMQSGYFVSKEEITADMLEG